VLVDAPPVVPAPCWLGLEEPVFDPWFAVPFVWTGRTASAVAVGCSDAVGAGASTLVLGVVGCCDPLVVASAEALGEGFVLVLELWEVWEPDRENAVAAAKTVARKATIGNAGPNTRMMLSGIPGNAALPVLPTLPLPGAADAVGVTTA
jgi:hypothetical protein